MSISEKLLALKTIKDNIKNAIISKGVEVLDSTPFSLYAEKIMSIIALTNLGEKTITANGIYLPELDDKEGYSKVTVNVPTATDKYSVSPSVKNNSAIECISDYHCSEPSKLDSHITQTGGTLNLDGTYKGGSGCYLSSNETLPLDTANSWEFGTKYTYNIGNGHDNIWGYTGGSDFKHPCLNFEGSNQALIFYLSSTGAGWDLNYNPSSLVPVNGTTYYIKAGFDGNEYYVDYNTTGWDDSFTRAFTLQTSTKVHCSVPAMLMNLSLNIGSYYAGGSMYLPETYIKINGAEYRRYAVEMQPIF